MLRILIIFLVLVAGIIIGPALANHQGFVLFQVSGYRVHMSLITFTLLEIFILLLFYCIYWLCNKFFLPKKLLQSWLEDKLPRKNAKRISQAQLFMLEGEYSKASKLFIKIAQSTNNTLLYLQAIQAEINNNQLDTAKKYLQEAAKFCQDDEHFAFRLVQLRLQIKLHDYHLAKKNAEDLLEQKGRSPELLRLAYQIFYEIKDYQSIINILPAMYKTAAYPETLLDKIKDDNYEAQIKQLAEIEGYANLMEWWQEQPKIIRNNLKYQKTINIYQNRQSESTNIIESKS